MLKSKRKKVIIITFVVLIIVIGVIIWKSNNITQYSNEKRLLLDAMNNKQTFIDKDNKETLLKNFIIIENQTAKVKEYAFVDFDNDGIEELVIYTTSNYGVYVILHYEEGKVYGYMIEMSSLENLKADGSFTGSNGANSTCYLRMIFDKNNYSINAEATYDTINKIYRINNKEVSLEEITEYIEKWNQKEDIKMIK